MTLCKRIPGISILCFVLLLLCFGAVDAKNVVSRGSRPVSAGKSKKGTKWFRSFNSHGVEGISSASGPAGFLKQNNRKASVRRRRKFSFSPVFEQVVKGATLNFSW